VNGNGQKEEIKRETHPREFAWKNYLFFLLFFFTIYYFALFSTNCKKRFVKGELRQKTSGEKSSSVATSIYKKR